MPERVFFVRGLARQSETDEGDPEEPASDRLLNASMVMEMLLVKAPVSSFAANRRMFNTIRHCRSLHRNGCVQAASQIVSVFYK